MSQSGAHTLRFDVVIRPFAGCVTQFTGNVENIGKSDHSDYTECLQSSSCVNFLYIVCAIYVCVHMSFRFAYKLIFIAQTTHNIQSRHFTQAPFRHNNKM